MRWIDITRIATRMLRANLLRTLLTSLGIATAVALIVILTGLGYGIQQLTIGSIVQSQSLLSMDVSASPDNTVSLDNDTYAAIRALPEVQASSPVFETDGQVIYNGKLASNDLLAVSKSYFAMDGIGVTRGRTLQDDQSEIVLSPQTLSLLNANPDTILGQQVQLRYTLPSAAQTLITVDKPLTVVGITTGTDSSSMFIPYTLIKDQAGAGITSIKITARNRENLVTLQDRLTQRGYTVNTLLDTLDSARRIFRGVTITLMVIALIALIIAAIGMFNTLTITLLERTREIGIMKAIGITDRDVLRLFLAEAILLGVIGGLMGVGVALGLDWLINKGINVIAAHYGGGSVTIFSYPSWFLLAMLLYPAALGVFTGVYPAIRAARLNPLNALRYE